jgi:hypothetical protein
MNTDFLLHSNINRLYTSIKNRIQSQINYNIDKKEQKYRNVVNKLLIKISKKKDLSIDDLNSMAIQTICPFLISKIQNTKLPDISFSQNRNVDRIIPQRSGEITKPNTREIDTPFQDNYNSTSNIIGKESNSISDTMEGFVNYDHSSENTLEGFDVNEVDNRIEDTVEHFDTTSPSGTLSPEIEDTNKQLVQELGEFKEAYAQTGILFNELRSKQILINELKEINGFFNNKEINKTNVIEWISTKLPMDYVPPDWYARDKKGRINGTTVSPDGTTVSPDGTIYSKNNYKDDFIKSVNRWTTTYTEKDLITKLQTFGEFGEITYTYNEYLAYTALMNKINDLQELKDGTEPVDRVFEKKDIPVLKTNDNNKFKEQPGAWKIKNSFFSDINGLTKDLRRLVLVDELQKKITFKNNNKQDLDKFQKKLRKEVKEKLHHVSREAVLREKEDVKAIRQHLRDMAATAQHNKQTENEAITALRLELKKLKNLNKESADNFMDTYQVSSDEITHKTMLMLDIVRHAENPKSGFMFFNGSTPKESNIIDFEINLTEPITLPLETEITLEYFSIYKFRGQTRSYLKETKQLEEFDSFVVKISGSNFDTIKQYSNSRSFSEEATIVVPNDAFGFSDANEGAGDGTDDGLKNQTSYTIKPKSSHVGILKNAGTITRLKITLMGTFVDALAAEINAGANTWTYLYPYASESRCKIGLMLKPMKPSRIHPRPKVTSPPNELVNDTGPGLTNVML